MWCCQPCPPQYQPLPISTGNVGIDRCGNLHYYAAPNVVHRPVHWHRWPVPSQQRIGCGRPGCTCGAGFSDSVARVLTAGAPMAQWMTTVAKP